MLLGLHLPQWVVLIVCAWEIPYSAEFSRHTIFADRVVGSVSRKKISRTKEILLGTPLLLANLAAPNFRGSRPSAKNAKIMRLENLALYGSHLQLATRGVRSSGYYISLSLFNDVLVMTTLTFFLVRLRRWDVNGNICSTSLGVNSYVSHDSACSTFSVNSAPADRPDSLLFEATGWSSDACSLSALTSGAHSAGQCLRRLMETRMVSEFGRLMG